ncbi:MAG TPA: glycosyltransferase [Candidatus Dojkabacteria bacterium]|nr:glycosyltransferase [Candidatus Dojkabacteria bacterium]
MKNLETRTIGLILLISGALYLSWVVAHINTQHLWFSLFSLLISVFSVISSILLVINNWSWKRPVIHKLAHGNEPKVGIIIPTWSEDPKLVQSVAKSVLAQDYPLEKIVLVISDDARNEELEALTYQLMNQYPTASIIYHTPPKKGDPLRKGEGKAGNLNSALELLSRDPSIHFIETRDADDFVVDKNFLRIVTAHLVRDEKLAFVQTIKKSKVNANDSFSNNETLFYHSLMLSKNAANAVFPCGSGLLWRKEALLDIDGFPSWNLVEDFQSGLEALRRGWKGEFVPIVGAYTKTPPEDIPNVYKQRGTWAADSLRLMFYLNKKGLTLRQKLHFIEPGWFYIFSGAYFLSGLIPVITLMYGILPVTQGGFDYFINVTPYILSTYLFLLSLDRKQGVGHRDIMNTIRLGFQLGPVYFGSLIRTLIYGKHRKPAYRLTRKYNRPGIYFGKTFTQTLMTALLIYATYIHIMNAGGDITKINLSTLPWALTHIYFLGGMFRLSVYKFNPFRLIGENIGLIPKTKQAYQ